MLNAKLMPTHFSKSTHPFCSRQLWHIKLSIIYNMVTATYRHKKSSIRFNCQQSSITSLFKHYRIEIWKWAAMWSFFLQRLNLVPRSYIILEHTVSMKFRAIRPKTSRNFQITKNFITQYIRWKNWHFTLWTIIYSLIMNLLWSPIYHKIEENYF